MVSFLGVGGGGGALNIGAVGHRRTHLEEKRICEAERKRKEGKARFNGPSSESSTLTCATCNRHFRVTIGIFRHQRPPGDTAKLFQYLEI